MKKRRQKRVGWTCKLSAEGIPLEIVRRVEEIAARIKKGWRAPRPRQWNPPQDLETE